MKIIKCEQGSPKWYSARLGIPTASDFDKIITTAGLPSKQQTKYMFKLAGEKVSGKAEETYQNGAMQRGKELEAEARNVYEFVTGEHVQQVGLCLTDGEYICGASPDGLIRRHGGLEIKCPSCSVHVEYLIGGTLPTDYYQQVQGGLFVTKRDWWDFMSYYPGLKPLIIRVLPDDKFQSSLEKEIVGFCTKLKDTIDRIR